MTEPKAVPHRRQTWCKFCRKWIGFVEIRGRWVAHDLIRVEPYWTMIPGERHKCDPADVQRVKSGTLPE